MAPLISRRQYSLIKARAAMNIPFSDTVAARVSVMSHKHDGFTDNVGNGQDLDDADSISARAKLLIQPSDTFSATFAQLFDEGQRSGTKRYLRSTPGRENSLRIRFRATSSSRSYTA